MIYAHQKADRNLIRQEYFELQRVRHLIRVF